ncbi:MAG: nodulation protein NfeD [Terrimonas sp.]|nr:nodulation protein NfeD [Terrimonas sp.]
MKRFLCHIVLFCLLPGVAPAQQVVSIAIDGTINPVTSDYIQRGIDKAARENAACLVIQLNTPGGLLKSTRVIVSSILDAPLPVVVYVSPNGAHAGSAGVFITMAGHIAAMAPGTNIGAAHPVSMQQMDPVMNEKATNDAAAFIRTIAQNRNRDTIWAEKAVRYSLSITAKEALEQNIIDLVAVDIPDLLRKIDGKIIETRTGAKTLHTADASVETEKMTWIENLLNILADPNIAYILMMLGFYGLLFELYSPGAIFPGVIGGICIILAFYAMHTLPVNYAALALILFGILLFILEIKIISHGLLSIGGTIALLMGSLMLIRKESSLEFVQLSKAIVIPAVAVTAAFFLFVVTMGIRAQKRQPVTGMEALMNGWGTALESFEQTGNVMIAGEIWQAESRGGTIEKGQKIKVTGRKKFLLFVEPVQTNN